MQMKLFKEEIQQNKMYREYLSQILTRNLILRKQKFKQTSDNMEIQRMLQQAIDFLGKTDSC